MRSINRYAAVCVLALALTSCQQKTTSVNTAAPPTPLLRASQALGVSATATTEAIFTVIDLAKQGTLDKNQTTVLLGILEKVDKGQLQASDAIRKLNALSDKDRGDLSAVMTPVLKAVNDGLTEIQVFGPDAQLKARALLLAVQSTLAVVQAALEAK